MIKKNISNQRGFSLLELLLVVAIIAILSLVIFGTVYNSSREKASKTAIVSSMNSLAKHMESKIDNKDFYPRIGGQYFKVGKLRHVEKYGTISWHTVYDSSIRDLINRFLKLNDIYILSTNGHNGEHASYCFSSTLKDGNFIIANETGVFESDENYCATISTS